MMFSIIAAVDKNRGIGQGGKLPWNLKGDMQHFKEVTLGQGKPNAVIMGRTTWDSIPGRFRPLEGRINVVLSRQGLELPQGVLGARSLDEALAQAEGQGAGEVFVIGGASVYAEAITHPACQSIYLTEIDGAFLCDAFFPAVPADVFERTEISEPRTEGSIVYRFVTYSRKR